MTFKQNLPTNPGEGKPEPAADALTQAMDDEPLKNENRISVDVDREIVRTLEIAHRCMEGAGMYTHGGESRELWALVGRTARIAKIRLQEAERTFAYRKKAVNAHSTLLAAAKLAVMECADLIGPSLLSDEAHTALNAAIELAGGWTEEENERLESLALGENMPDDEEGRRDASLAAEEEAIMRDPEQP